MHGSMVSNIVELKHTIAACLVLEGNFAFTPNHNISPYIYFELHSFQIRFC